MTTLLSYLTFEQGAPALWERHSVTNFRPFLRDTGRIANFKSLQVSDMVAKILHILLYFLALIWQFSFQG